MRDRLSIRRLLGKFAPFLLAVLLVRLVLMLFAARPGNPVAAALLAATAPLAWPFMVLDRWTAQPRWGARLELATLAACVVITLLGLWGARRKRDV